MTFLPFPFPGDVVPGHTLPGQHRYGDSWVTELYERPIFSINSLSGQQDVLGAHIPMHQILVLLQKSRERTVSGMLCQHSRIATPQGISKTLQAEIQNYSWEEIGGKGGKEE